MQSEVDMTQSKKTIHELEAAVDRCLYMYVAFGVSFDFMSYIRHFMSYIYVHVHMYVYIYARIGTYQQRLQVRGSFFWTAAVDRGLYIAFGVSFNFNLQSQSHWSVFNRTWQKRPRERDHGLRFEIEENGTPFSSITFSNEILLPSFASVLDVQPSSLYVEPRLYVQ